MKKEYKEYIGKIIIGVGIALIAIPFLTAIIRDLGSYIATGELARNIWQNLSVMDRSPNVILKWIGSMIVPVFREINIQLFFQRIFLRNLLCLFIPNLLIIFGFCFLLRQKQNIDIKNCFNKIVIIGLAINILVLFSFFGLYNNLYYRFLMSFSRFKWLSFIIPYDILRSSSVWVFIYRFSAFIVSFLFHLILVAPTLVISAGYMKFFSTETEIISAGKVVSDGEVPKSYFDGGLLQCIGWLILGIIVTFFSFGICSPLAVWMIIRWQTNHTVIQGRRLQFNGKALSFFGHWLLWSFLTIITFGIFSFWFFIFVRKWITKNTTFADSGSEDKESYFDGGLLQYIGWSILGCLVTVFTLGICLPWAVCMIIGWQTNHTVIQGRRLKFNGTALSLFGHWLLWSFLTIITFGIFGFWFFIFVRKWITKNTTFADSDYVIKDNSTHDALPDALKCKSCNKTFSSGYTSCPHCGSKDIEYIAQEQSQNGTQNVTT